METPQQMSGKSAFDYFIDEKIKTGWNLGDTLDAHEKRISCETLWDNPKANHVLFSGVKKAGFDIVRIPVTWMGHFGGAPDFLIEESFLQRVEEVTGYAQKAGLKVIINMHHDGMTESPKKNSGWHSINRARKSKKGYDEVTRTFMQLWKQIARYFKNHGDWLFFEPMNEIHDGHWGNDENGELNVTQNLKKQFEIINKWNQVFTDTVRETGGNNSERFLVIPGYCTVAEYTTSFLKLPKDSALDKQVVTFHYYDPYEFSIEGSQSKWGSVQDRKKVDRGFTPFRKKFIDKKIPVIIGESGAVLQLHPDDKEKEEIARKSRLDYISFVYNKAKEYKLVPFYWDCGAVTGGGEKFGLFNRRNGKPNSPESDRIIKAMTGY
ncbi:MAG: glycoside hydrolase family 5 protein [Treponema sp.]|nr:glycoside hydrolase family 5 protein [Treponema sp.]MCL2271875.1 glycoside hydrolase family 5 protein [Treponema sp.]